MDNTPSDIITATIPEFCRVSGNGRSKAYELIAEGKLQSIKIGKRRLIVINSYRQLVNDLLSEAEGQQQAVATTNTARQASANRPDLTTVSCPSDPCRSGEFQEHAHRKTPPLRGRGQR